MFRAVSASALALAAAACVQHAPVAPADPAPPVEGVADPSAPPAEEILARSRMILEQEAYDRLGPAVMNEVRAAPAAILARHSPSLPRMIRQPDGNWKAQPATLVAAVRDPHGWTRITSEGRASFDPLVSLQLDWLLRQPELWAEPVIASGGCVDGAGVTVLVRRDVRERLSNLPCGMVGRTGEATEIVLAGTILDWSKVPAENRPAGMKLIRFDDLQGYYQFSSGITSPRRLDIRSSAEWEAQWRRMTARHGDAPPAPRVDFSREMVLLAAMGERPTSGFSVAIERVVPRADALEVFVRETSPGPRCGVTQAITSPVDIVRVPATPRPVRWVVERDVRDCP